METGQPYAYTGDDPVNAIDPLGQASEHKKGKRPSTQEEHEKGQARQQLTTATRNSP